MNLEEDIREDKKERLREAINYFKSNLGYRRLFCQMKGKLESFEQNTPGKVRIERPTREEKECISGWMKKDYRANQTITISLKKFQERLGETKFSGIELQELLEAYFQEKIVPKKQQRRMKEQEQEEFFAQLVQKWEGTRAGMCLQKIIEERGETYDYLKNQYRQKEVDLVRSLNYVCVAVNHLPKEKIKLPVFSAQVINNPHELDKNQLTGKLFILILCEEEKRRRPKTTEELSEFYYQHQLLIDDLSNMVLVKNILGKKQGKVHPRMGRILERK